MCLAPKQDDCDGDHLPITHIPTIAILNYKPIHTIYLINSNGKQVCFFNFIFFFTKLYIILFYVVLLC